MSAPDEKPGASPSSSALSDPFQEEQTVLILVGLIASGKSTFAQALESHFPRFRRCNQDDLGNRWQVEEVAHQTLCEGRSPCIDRTNFNAIQRSYWTGIARTFRGASISIIVFDTPYEVCASRLEHRISHPTIKSPQHGLAVLQKFASDFQLPSPEEEYDHLIHLRPADHPHPEYTRDDVLSILERLKASTRGSGSPGKNVTQRSPVSSFGRAGRYSRTNRARGYRGGDGHHGRQGSMAPRGTSHDSAWFAGRVGGSSNSNWRRPSPGAAANREKSDHQRSAAAASLPSMEGSKDSAEELHNST